MYYKHYIAKKRARFHGISEQVNIPYGTALETKGQFLALDGKPVCAVTSQNAYDYFAQNDDGCGEERGRLTLSIINRLSKHDQNHQARWNRVWEDAVCQQYRRPEHEDHWLWNYDFYNAPVADLQHIEELINI